MITYDRKSYKKLHTDEIELLNSGYAYITKKDAAFLASQFGDRGFTEYASGRDKIKSFKEAYPEDSIIIAYENTCPIGFISYRIEPIKSEAYPLLFVRELAVNIGLIYVTEEKRKQKIGTELINKACDVTVAKNVTISFNTFNKEFVRFIKKIRNWKTVDEYFVYIGRAEGTINSLTAEPCMNLNNNKYLSRIISEKVRDDYNAVMPYLPVSSASISANDYINLYMKDLKSSVKTVFVPASGKHGCIIAEPIGVSMYTRLYTLTDKMWLNRSEAGAYLRAVMKIVNDSDKRLNRFYIISGRQDLSDIYDKHNFKCYYKKLRSRI